MRTYLQMLAFIVIILAPFSILAQDFNNKVIQNPPAKFNSSFDSGAIKSRLNKTPLLTVKSEAATPFEYHLQSIVPIKNKITFTEQLRRSSLGYDDMPIVKPGKTTKILIAKLDPNFPYSYNMPVVK